VEGKERGSLVYGTEGVMLLDGNDYTVFDKNKKKVKEVKGNISADPTNTISASGVDLERIHFTNFIESIRGKAQPNSPIVEGHKSVTMLHLGNIAWRVGRQLNIDPANGHILHDSDAMKFWSRKYEPGWEPKV
jgi:hypothetical protein